MGERWKEIVREIGVESHKGDGSPNLAWVPAERACKRIAELEAERDEAKELLREAVRWTRKSFYERCPDCDYPNKCARAGACLEIQPHGEPTWLQKAAAEEVQP